MKQKVMLAIQGRQAYQDQDPEVIQLTTEGWMEFRDGGWEIYYEESDLTGMGGVTTTFRVEPDKVTLNRRGKLVSEMVFQLGVQHDSLYRMEFGALMITVCANKVEHHLNEADGTIDLTYAIDIENTAAGFIEYHLDIKAK